MRASDDAYCRYCGSAIEWNRGRNVWIWPGDATSECQDSTGGHGNHSPVNDWDEMSERWLA